MDSYGYPLKSVKYIAHYITLLLCLCHDLDIYRCEVRDRLGLWCVMTVILLHLKQITIRRLTTRAPKSVCLHSSFCPWFWGSAPHVWSNKSFIPDVMSTRDWLYEARAQTPALAHTRSLARARSNFLRSFQTSILRTRALLALREEQKPRWLRFLRFGTVFYTILFSCKLCLSPSAILWRIDDSAQGLPTFTTRDRAKL